MKHRPRQGGLKHDYSFCQRLEKPAEPTIRRLLSRPRCWSRRRHPNQNLNQNRRAVEVALVPGRQLAPALRSALASALAWVPGLAQVWVPVSVPA
jgi:hypothetical protein